MSSIYHPSKYIDPSIVLTLRNFAGQAEKLKQLHPEQLALIQQQQWFRLFVPKIYNGLEETLMQGLLLEETLAWTDGSIGWTVTLCAGAGWFSAFLNSALAAKIFRDPAACIAGSGKSTGIAKKTGDRYEISGNWEYATGANNATCFTANCVIEENGLLLKNANGEHFIRPFLFLKEEVMIMETWKAVGMIATGSNSFAVHELIVPGDRLFDIESASPLVQLPLFAYPFLQFAETTLAVNSSGMAIRFLDLCAKIFAQKPNLALQASLAEVSKELHKARQDFYTEVENSWKECVGNFAVSSPVLQRVSHLARHLAYTSRRVVDSLYPHCGMQAANPETEINRVWRNLHTASQHNLLNTSM
ncbi:MAG: acyl-CoA dehydrogenase [Bacteroidota bacterium]|nr:acyl-CoA dehydrogenase [Bacteroidota bacterium]